jgi:hypothetical protein
MLALNSERRAKMKAKLVQVVFSLFFVLVSSGTTVALTIDFEGLGLEDGFAVPAIGIVSFDGSAAVQDGEVFAFISAAGADTGNTGSFNTIGNTFITNLGGFRTNETVKTLEITFSSPVTNLQFDVADVDSGPFTVEQLTATVYDSSNTPLGNEVREAPTTGDFGDGEVVNIDFGTLVGIRRLYIELRNVGTVPDETGFGFGLDNLQFDPEPPPSPPTGANVIVILDACINPSGLIRVRNSGEECRPRETAIQFLAGIAPVECPCFTAEELEAITFTRCSRVGGHTPNVIALYDDATGGAAFSWVDGDNIECRFKDHSVSPAISRYVQGLYDLENKECERLLLERAEELGLVCE